MRISRLIAVLVLAQALVIGLGAAFTYVDYRSERDQLIMGDLLTLRFMTLGKEYDHSFRSGFLDVSPGIVTNLRGGRAPVVSRPDFARTGDRTVEVTLSGDLDKEKSPELAGILHGSRDVVLKERGDEMYVAARLYRSGEGEPYGIIRIINSPRGLLRQVISRNLPLYLIIFLLVNGQAVLLMGLFARRREVVFRKGYLKEHALGALKLQHKVLGDIIADHEESDPAAGESYKDEGKIVPFPRE